jgi:hypothetical protein
MLTALGLTAVTTTLAFSAALMPTCGEHPGGKTKKLTMIRSPTHWNIDGMAKLPRLARSVAVAAFILVASVLGPNVRMGDGCVRSTTVRWDVVPA